MEILTLKLNETWTMKFKNLWINARNSVRRPEASNEDVDFRFGQIRLSSSKKARNFTSVPMLIRPFSKPSESEFFDEDTERDPERESGMHSYVRDRSSTKIIKNLTVNRQSSTESGVPLNSLNGHSSTSSIINYKEFPKKPIDECNEKLEDIQSKESDHHSVSQSTNQSVVQEDVLFLADLPPVFFSPLLSALIFEPDLSAYSSAFLLKNMIIFALTIEAAFILFRSYLPSSLSFWQNCLKKLAIPLAFGTCVYYPLVRLLSNFEQLSSITVFCTVIICGLLLVGHRYATYMIKARAISMSPPIVVHSLFEIIRSGSKRLFNGLQHVFTSTPSTVVRKDNFDPNVLFLDERELKAKQDSTLTSVLVVGMFDDIERALLSKEQMFNSSFRPIAIITPDSLDFGKYIDDVPVIGNIDFLDECLSDGTFNSVVIIEDSLPPSITEQVEQCARSKLISVLTLVRQRYVRRKMQY
ncbi:MAG: hypothetical protein LBJ89_01635 [Holosporales bacterium]|nr:hypothetical protein [Holosporales bacterium]